MPSAKLYILVTISAVFKRRNGEWSVEVGAVGPPILQDAHLFTQTLLKDQPLGIISPPYTVTFVDDLLRKNQQLNMQVSCLNQELAQLKKLEETVTLLHESQRQDWILRAGFWKQIFTFLYLLCFTWQVDIYILSKLTIFCV